LIKILLNAGKKSKKIDVYSLLSAYVSWLNKKNTKSPRSIKDWVSTSRHFLEVYDVEISPRKFQLKVKLPRVIRPVREALTKEDIQTILNACPSIKLKTYLLFLASAGTRATETLSIRLCDINLKADPATVFIRGEYTKTKASRTIFLTSELAEAIKSWIQYKHRTRRIAYYVSKTKKVVNKTVTPVMNDKVYLFASDTEKNPQLENLYTGYLMSFEKVLDRLGGKFAEFEDDNKRRRKITLHSFRRFTKSTISDLGLSDYSEYYIGHHMSVYWQRSPKEKIELFRKVEPYLTFLDQTMLATRHADTQSRLESIEKENIELRQNMNKVLEMIQQNPELANVKPESLTKKIKKDF
jgi:integrase